MVNPFAYPLWESLGHVHTGRWYFSILCQCVGQLKPRTSQLRLFRLIVVLWPGYTVWLVVSNMFFSISYMGCHPNPIDELICFKIVIAPPTSYGL